MINNKNWISKQQSSLKQQHEQHFAYLTRKYKQIDGMIYQKYQLHSIAKPHKKGIQVYNHYFPSHKKKTVKQVSSRDDLSNLSIFFIRFLDIIILRYCIKTTKTAHNHIFYANLAKQIWTQSKDKQFSIIQKYINKIKIKYNNQIQNVQESKLKEAQIYVQKLKRVDKIIQQLLSTHYNYISQNYQSIKSQQQLPNASSKQQLISIIKYNFECIKNNKLLFYTASILNKIMQQNQYRHNFINMRIYTTKTTGNDQQSNQIKIRRIKFQKQPIMILLRIYIKVKERQHKIKKKIMNNCIIDIIEECSKYNNYTELFLPAFSFKDIFFDQKSLKIHIDYKTLILDIIGLVQQYASIENKIACGATPNVPDVHKCYLQLSPDYCYKLQKKRFTMSQQSQKQKVNDIFDNYKQFSGIQPDINEIIQNIHVWRILTVIYYLIYGRHFTVDLYSQYYQEYKDNQSKQKVFNMNIYYKILKNAYQMMYKNRNAIKQLFKITEMKKQQLQQTQKTSIYEQQSEQSDKQLPYSIKIRQIFEKKQKQKSNKIQDNNFDFTLKSLRNLFNIDTKIDYLLNDMRFAKHGSYIAFRLLLLKQIQKDMNLGQPDKGYFRRLHRFIVHLINLSLSIYDHSYCLAYIVWQQRSKEQIRSQLYIFYSKENNNLKLKSQMIKRQKNIQKLFEKIQSQQSYKKAPQYLQYIQKIKTIKTKISTMIQLDNIMNQEKTNKNIKQQNYQKQFYIIDEHANYCISQSQNIIKNFINKFINVKEMNDIHRLTEIFKEKELSQKYAEFHHKRLIVLLIMYLKTNHLNWKNNQELYNTFLFSNKKKQPISNASIDQINSNIQKIQFVWKILDDYPYLDYNKLKEQKKQNPAAKFINKIHKIP